MPSAWQTLAEVALAHYDGGDVVQCLHLNSCTGSARIRVIATCPIAHIVVDKWAIDAYPIAHEMELAAG